MRDVRREDFGAGADPAYFTMGAEFMEPPIYGNAGVMLLNLIGLRRTYAAFADWTFSDANVRRGLHFGKFGPGDQGAYAEFYEGALQSCARLPSTGGRTGARGGPTRRSSTSTGRSPTITEKHWAAARRNRPSCGAPSSSAAAAAAARRAPTGSGFMIVCLRRSAPSRRPRAPRCWRRGAGRPRAPHSQRSSSFSGAGAPGA